MNLTVELKKKFTLNLDKNWKENLMEIVCFCQKSWVVIFKSLIIFLLEIEIKHFDAIKHLTKQDGTESSFVLKSRVNRLR